MSLLFEDLFKRLNSDLKRQADQTLSKANRAGQVGLCVCVCVCVRAHTCVPVHVCNVAEGYRGGR